MNTAKRILSDPMWWIVITMYVAGLVNGAVLALRYG